MSANDSSNNTTADVIGELNRLVEKNHRVLAHEKSVEIGEVPRLRECRNMSTMMLLEAMDSEALATVKLSPVFRTDGIVEEHRYVVLTEGSTELVIDGMWQQFVPEDRRTSELAPALIGEREEVQALAIEAGVAPETAQALWGVETLENTQRYLTPQERIAQAYDNGQAA